MVSGWGGDYWFRWGDYWQGLDRILPATVAFAGFDNLEPHVQPVRGESAIKTICSKRAVWVIPWLESDGGSRGCSSHWHPQEDLAQMEKLVHSAARLGYRGCLGLHWQTAGVGTQRQPSARGHVGPGSNGRVTIGGAMLRPSSTARPRLRDRLPTGWRRWKLWDQAGPGRGSRSNVRGLAGESASAAGPRATAAFAGPVRENNCEWPSKRRRNCRRSSIRSWGRSRNCRFSLMRTGPTPIHPDSPARPRAIRAVGLNHATRAPLVGDDGFCVGL